MARKASSNPATRVRPLGNYPEPGRQAASMIPQATLVPFPELGHSPQVEAPQVFHKALLRVLNEAR
ncbi:alpha/beta fold hydrolase [Stutzerimonas stutzeri]|jgi:pimeloyl-ACP methyl ester carboxylesterase|uniref:alpha/beta fold hydrolase n=1 Tax=Stutzerimonas stutzeri TaxID=316 RepID=UPI003C6F5E99